MLHVVFPAMVSEGSEEILAKWCEDEDGEDDGEGEATGHQELDVNCNQTSKHLAANHAY